MAGHSNDCLRSQHEAQRLASLLVHPGCQSLQCRGGAEAASLLQLRGRVAAPVEKGRRGEEWIECEPAHIYVLQRP